MSLMAVRFLRPAMSASKPNASGETELVLAAASGDRTAFAKLYERYARMVHGVVLARVPHAYAEDLVQDVFLTAFTKLDGLRTPESFPSWLAAIARNRATEHHRANRIESETCRQLASNATGQRDGEAHVVLDIIRQLPDAYRETLTLRLVEGMTGPEIAQRTGLTPDSVRVNLFRGMKMLRERLK